MTASAAPSSALKIVPVFAGGGTRLPAHIGILKALEELTVEFDHLVGVSGGSIVASLFAAGFSVNEMKSLAIHTDFAKFKGNSLITLLRSGGLSNGDTFEKWIDTLLGGVTFSELTKNLSIVATDVSKGGPVIFSKTRTPDMKVSKAVRFSMSIPLLFSFQEFNKLIMVDGSILSEDALHRDWAEDGTPVICFRLRSNGERKNAETSIIPLKSYITMLIRTFMNTISREYVSNDFWHRTLLIDTGDISPVDFKLTQADKESLFDAGYNSAINVLPLKLNNTIPTKHE
ncbi:MAG: patatin-like phospholipase family protein [Hahellaceae bacterium]|nr:patatin-like phospholipase family protein [Hahellaceae bacterium]